MIRRKKENTYSKFNTGEFKNKSKEYTIPLKPNQLYIIYGALHYGTIKLQEPNSPRVLFVELRFLESYDQGL